MKRPDIVQYVSKLLGTLDDDQKFGVRLVADSLSAHKQYVVAICVFGVITSIFEGGSMGMVALAVSVLLGSNDNVGGGVLNYVTGLLSKFFGENYDKGDVFVTLILLAISSQVLRSFFQYASKWFAIRLQTNIMRDLQKQVIDHMMRLRFLEISKFPPGNLGEIIAQSGVVSSVAKHFNEAVLAVLIVIGYLIFLLWMNASMTVGAVFFVVLLYFALSFIVKRLRAYASDATYMTFEATKRAWEYLNVPKLIRVFSIEEHVKKRILDVRERVLKAREKGNALEAAIEPLIESSTMLFSGILLVLGYFLAKETFLNHLPVLFAFLLVLNRLMPQMKSFNNTRAGISRIRPALGIIARFLRPHDFSYQRTGGKLTSGLKHSIVFDNVSYCYQGASDRALKGVTFRIESGGMTAIVGRSGSGKSTIVDILLHLLDDYKGSVLIDSVELTNLDIANWREHIGYVDQDISIINASIEDNILLGCPNATRSEIQAAVKAAHIEEFIVSQSKGYQTELGEKGGKMSGGERQRIGIARALIRKPKILILDEATSALDTVTEMYMRESISKLKALGVTVIVIAHRLSTIKDADKIVVLESGKVVEQGDHDSLLAKGKYYNNIWNAK